MEAAESSLGRAVHTLHVMCASLDCQAIVQPDGPTPSVSKPINSTIVGIGLKAVRKSRRLRPIGSCSTLWNVILTAVAGPCFSLD